jgi:diguanylate cyclase (GGDEF)-like protein/PAS domain S-box-containing protein
MRVLLIGRDTSHGRAVCEALADVQDGSLTLECATGLSDGLERLSQKGIAAVLLDLCLPDCKGIACFDQVWRAAPQVPILLIGSVDAENTAAQAVKRGAQDVLSSARVERHSLPRAILHAVEWRAAEERLLVEQRRADFTLNSIGDAVISIDLASKVTFLNRVAERMTGWLREEALGRPISEVLKLIDAGTREPPPNPLQAAERLGRTVNLTLNCLVVARDGTETPIEDSASPIYDHSDQPIGAVMVFHDVSAARELSLQAIHLSQHDFLTGLPNRVLLNDRLTHAIARSRRNGHHLAVLFVDLDRFKNVNDGLGHVIGDSLLQSVAARLVQCVRGSDTVTRQGGDEFVVLLSEVEHADDAAISAERIIAALIAPHNIAHHNLHVTATIGISIYPEDGPDAPTLIKCADTAMYHAKESGRNNYQFFEPEMNARAVERQWIEASLYSALSQREFVLYYQPKVDLETGELIGAEALIRWMHPERGLMVPIDFVPIAEDCGLIVPIGQWVVREACTQVRAWIGEGLRPISVAVNISAVEFRDPRFLENVRAVLGDTGLAPRYLEVELTESSLMQHAESSVLTLQSLKAMGMQVAIDDFGTGYSSLSYLRQFPIDALKVDQSFIHEISTNPAGTSIVRAVISMGRSLGHRVIAEGVETREQLAFLRAQRCAEGQGYYFSRPVPADDFAKLLETGLPKQIQKSTPSLGVVRAGRSKR